jgi:hypothetical protein
MKCKHVTCCKRFCVEVKKLEFEVKKNLNEVKRLYRKVDTEAKRFCASHAWIVTHKGQDFDVKIVSSYCLRVHNTSITVSGNDINYKKDEDDKCPAPQDIERFGRGGGR